MPNTKVGTTWAPDIRPEKIETFEETYTPEGGEEQTLTYKAVAHHPIISSVLDKLAFFRTHVGAVWYNLAERKTLLTKLNELDAELRDVNAKLKEATLKFVDSSFDSVTLGEGGYYTVPDDKIPGTKNYLFATITYYGSTKTKTAICIHGMNRQFYINGTAGEVIKVLRIRFYYM